MQASGKLNLAKQKQYRQQPASKRLERRGAIRREELRKEKEHLRKIGKLDDYSTRKYKR